MKSRTVFVMFLLTLVKPVAAQTSVSSSAVGESVQLVFTPADGSTPVPITGDSVPSVSNNNPTGYVKSDSIRSSSVGGSPLGSVLTTDGVGVTAAFDSDSGVVSSQVVAENVNLGVLRSLFGQGFGPVTVISQASLAKSDAG